MLSSQSIQLIFSSWDVIKNIPDYQETFSNQLSEKLSDSTVAEWFSGPANPHHMVFVKMIDLIVHLLGPDLDVIIEELTAQGRRHHRYHSNMIGFFHEDSFAPITDAFVEIVRTALQEQATKEVNEINEESVLHPGQMEAVTTAWSDIFTMIRAIMKQGVKIEVRRLKKRAERRQKEMLAKQERRASGATESTMSESDSVTSASSDSFARLMSPLRKSRSKVSPTRSATRTLSSTLGSMVSSSRSKPEVRAGLAMLNDGPAKKSSKLEKLSKKSGSMGSLRIKGVKTSLSMGRLSASRR